MGVPALASCWKCICVILKLLNWVDYTRLFESSSKNTAANCTKLNRCVCRPHVPSGAFTCQVGETFSRSCSSKKPWHSSYIKWVRWILSYHIIHVKDDRFIGHGLNLSWKGERPHPPRCLRSSAGSTAGVTGPHRGQEQQQRRQAGFCWTDGGSSSPPSRRAVTTAWDKNSARQRQGKKKKEKKKKNNVPRRANPDKWSL